VCVEDPEGDGNEAAAAEAFAVLQAHVFRDGSAAVPGGVRATPRRRGGAAAPAGGELLSEVRLLREDMNAGFARLAVLLEAQLEQ